MDYTPDNAPLPLASTAIDALAEELIACAMAQSSQRWLLGVAGIPGSGKSTLASQLFTACNQRQPGVAALVPMDGFHLRNERLMQLGLRDRKGSPPTFDVPAYLTLLQQVRDASQTVCVPHYDRTLHEPVLRDDPSHRIGAEAKLVITEGNYLLLDLPPWSQLAQLLDECWWLETNVNAARQWIIERHIKGGRSPQDAQRHYERNDLPNTQLILSQMRPPDRRVCWPVAH